MAYRRCPGAVGLASQLALSVALGACDAEVKTHVGNDATGAPTDASPDAPTDAAPHAVLAFGNASYSVSGTVVTGAQGMVTAQVRNQGPSPATGFAAAVSPGEFSVSHTCGSTLAAGATCNLTVTFAPSSPGPKMTTLTADADDASPVSATVSANGTCTVGQTACGNACVNLLEDEENCGACGYEVRGARSCMAGRPTPGWMPMPNAPWSGDRVRLQSWTGRRYMVLTDNHEYFFDPTMNTWSADDAFPRPPVAFNYPATGNFMWAKVPRRNEVAVVDSTETSTGDDLWLFADPPMGNPSWTGHSGGMLGQRRAPSVAATATDVYVAFGHGFESIVRYDLATGAFTRGADHPSDCTQGLARYINPVAVVGNNILTHGGYATGNAWCLDTDSMKLPLPGMAAWAPVNANLDPRLGHIFVEFGGRLLFGGGRRITPPTNADCRAAGLWFIDPATDTKTPLTPFPRPRLDPNFPNDLPNVSFVVRTGRGVMVWGGNHVSCSNGTLRAFAGGSIGVASATGNDIVWAALPDAGEPTARHFGADSSGFGNRQHSWTGYEAIVFSGHEFNGTVDVLTFNGSTYQPPVGCVCPSADAEACDGVTNLPSPNECAPQ